MSFQIDAIILYGPEEEPRVLPLRPGELNVITGYSKTGKSSLISIVHYCLGSDECGVAYGHIRSTVDWYALRLVMEGQQIFVARQAPAQGKESNSAACYEVATQVTIPLKSAVSANTNMAAVIELLSRAAGIVDNVHEAPPGQTRPPLVATVKHALSFCFQPQDEIISRRHLFFHQGEPFVKQAIQDTLPYFLGAIDDDHVIKLGRLRELRQQQRRLGVQVAEAKALSGEGTTRGAALLSEAVDLGLVKMTNPNPALEDLLSMLRAVVDNALPTLAESYEPGALVDEYERLLEQRERVTRSLRRAETDLQAAQGLIADRSGYARESAEQVGRLQTLELLPPVADAVHSCPLCASPLPAVPTAPALRRSLETLQSRLVSVNRDNPHLERLTVQLEEQVLRLRRQLANAREAIEALERSRQRLANYRDFTAKAAHVRGRISVCLEAGPKEVTGADALARRLALLNEQIGALESELDQAGVEERLESLAVLVSRRVTDAGQQLRLEHSAEGLRFNPRRLAVIADTTTGPIPMEKMGSGENWVGYHLAVLLALHQVFTEANRPVPRFLFVDQPSQVSFPADRDPTGRMEAAAEGKPLDAERATVLRMFELIRDVVASLNGRFQVILTEHADPDVEWFDAAVVERWRGSALIPERWIRDASDV